MRGGDEQTGKLFSYVDLEKRVRSDHPLRAIRGLVNEALVALEQEFAALYAPIGRPSIAPEKLLRAMLLQAFYSIRSERQLMERLEFDLLFRWFVGLGIDDPAWDHSTFSKNRDRLLDGAVAGRLLNAILSQPRVKRLLSTEHFSVDGTQIKAWAGQKSVRRKDGSDDDRPSEDWRGERRSNETHASKTDPDSLLYRKSNAAPALPSFLGHIVTDNRHGLVVNVQATQANGTAERDAAAVMLDELAVRKEHITVGADKAYDTRGFVRACRDIDVTPHVAQNLTRIGGSAIDARTTRHVGYEISQRKRKCIEQCFGWAKVIGPMRQVMVRGLDKVDQVFTLTMAAYNLVRLRNLAGVFA